MKLNKIAKVFLFVCLLLVAAQPAFASGPVVGPIVWNNIQYEENNGVNATVADGYAEVDFNTAQSSTTYNGRATSETVIDVQNVNSISFDYSFNTDCYDGSGDYHTATLSIYLQKPDGTGSYILNGVWDTPGDQDDDNDSGSLTVNLAQNIQYYRESGAYYTISNNPIPSGPFPTPFTGKVFVSVDVNSTSMSGVGYTNANASISNIHFN